MGLSTKQVSNDQHHHALDQWAQGLLESSGVGVVVEDQLANKPNSSKRQQNQQQQQNQPEPLKCPRCGSMNTKFCYYNNYNKSQPRHFCKACKRHWTKGGTLRSVPVGGGRKNKRLKVTSNTATTNTSSITTTTTNSSSAAATKNSNGAHSFSLASLMNNPSSVSNDAINSGKSWMSSIKNSTFSSPLFSFPQDQSLQFSFSSLSPFDTIPCSFPSSNLSLGNNFFEHNSGGELDHVDSTSTITTVTPPPTTTTTTTASTVFNSHSWQQQGDPATNDADEMPIYWNWNVADPFASSDINVSWDEL